MATPGPFKCVLFLECTEASYPQISYGWSETYYNNAASVTVAEAATKSLITYRTGLTAYPCNVSAYRITDMSNVRSSYLVPLGPNAVPAGNPITGFTTDADNSPTAAMMRLYAINSVTGSVSSRALYLRGNPDDAFNERTPLNNDAQMWAAQYSNLGQFLSGQSAGVSWLIRDRATPIFPPNAGANVVAINTWVPSAANPYATNIQLAAVVPAGTQYLQLYKVKGLPQAPGLVKILTAGSTPPLYQIQFITPQYFVYQMDGFALAYAPVYSPISQVLR